MILLDSLVVCDGLRWSLKGILRKGTIQKVRFLFRIEGKDHSRTRGSNSRDPPRCGVVIFYLELFWAVFLLNRRESAWKEYELMPFSDVNRSGPLGGCKYSALRFEIQVQFGRFFYPLRTRIMLFGELDLSVGYENSNNC